jgi:hypothetical protein
VRGLFPAELNRLLTAWIDGLSRPGAFRDRYYSPGLYKRASFLPGGSGDAGGFEPGVVMVP